MSKKNGQLSVALFKYYITFLVVLSGIFVIAYIVVSVSLAKQVHNNKAPIYDLIRGEYNDYKDIDPSDLKKIGGYIEVLDLDKKVVYRKGELPDILKDNYTETEFIDIISRSGENAKYYVGCNSINAENGKDYIVLVRIPNEKVNVSLNIQKIPLQVGKPILFLYLKVVSIALIISLVSILGYSILTARKINKPLKMIDEALGKVLEGDYEEKLVIEGEREFVRISNTINFLIDKLKNSREENSRLEQSKTRMLIDLSHDIKTPITTIRGFSAALYEGLVDDEDKKQKYYKTIYNKSERVGELVDDLFEFVKMDSTQYILKIETVDICEFLRQIVVAYFDEIEEKKFELIVIIPEEVVNLKIDGRLFRRAVTNLIENSLKYNPEKTTLRIELKNYKRYIMIYVADNGIGIPLSIRSKVFEAFIRGDTSRGSDGGSGLGLAIANKIISNHGGEISLDPSKDEDKTIFAIRMYKDI
ncbi:HAMP domain-containing sensor histidine kinase [Clostridium vincentii]|uniref:histidine kinase n=1 Tax=Clostridium vincentii TaxID=52704 RepID=A0A2T0BCA7_9CLOT|nr:HAMP domain-containing sensor histidine kinase [Clostridium vincentii]PRR81472.1 Sensor histidine kinase YycG [Clostridium vincentii]